MPGRDQNVTARQPLYYLVTPAGFPNYGDELIAAGWLRHLAEVAPEATVWVDTHSPGSAQVLLGELHPHVRFTDTLWRLCWEAPSDDVWEVAAWVRSAIANPRLAPRWQHGIELLTSADVLHLLGGGYINRIWPRHIGLLAGAAAAARRGGGRAVGTGLGLFPPDPDAGPLLRGIAEDFELIDVRDTPSAELLGVRGGIDDAFFALRPEHVITPAQAWPDAEPPEVMLSLQGDLLDIGAGRLAGAVLSILRAWKVPGEKLCVVEGIPGADSTVFELLQHDLPGARRYSFTDLWRRGLPVSGEQTWISTRFHLHLVAAASGASGVAVPISSEYYLTKHRSLVDLGSNWTLLDDLSAVPERPEAGGFDLEDMRRCRDLKLGVANTIYPPRVVGHLSTGAPPRGGQKRWGRKLR